MMFYLDNIGEAHRKGIMVKSGTSEYHNYWKMDAMLSQHYFPGMNKTYVREDYVNDLRERNSYMQLLQENSNSERIHVAS